MHKRQTYKHQKETRSHFSLNRSNERISFTRLLASSAHIHLVSDLGGVPPVAAVSIKTFTGRGHRP